MHRISLTILCVLFIGKIAAKDLHIKENSMFTSKDNSISDLTLGFDDPFTKNERFARHVELVTESVVEHLMKEIKKRYPKQNNTSKILQKMRRKLQMRLNKKNRLLMKKHHTQIVNTTNKI